MSHPGRFLDRFRALFGRRVLDAELDEEIRFHLEKEIEKNLKSGLGPAEARREALIAFGGVERFREGAREERGVRPLENLLQDARYALRQLRKNPGFTLVAILTLALGIGATTVVFSVFNTVVLRPLPFQEAHRLVRIRELTPQGDPMSVSDANFLDFREQSHSFQEMVAVFTRPLVLTREGEPVQVGGMAVTAGMFGMLGVSPVLGRDFVSGDFSHGGEPQAVLLGNGLWRQDFGADPGIVGQTVVLDGIARVVVGVLPALDRPFRFDVWLPFVADPAFPRGDHRREVFARLAAGVTVEQARDELNRIQARLGEEYPTTNAGYQIWVRTLPEWLVGPQVTRITEVLLGAVGLLLLLACVSVSNLLVARGTARQREISLRAALGAARIRLLSQLLVESLILAGLGATIGILTAYWALPLIQTLESTPLPRLDQVSLDATVLAFATGATLLSALTFGLTPALQGSRVDLMDLLRSGTHMVSVRSRRLRDGLVATQLALAMILLVGAGLLATSFLRMSSVGPGFDPDGVLLVQLSLPADRYPEMSPEVGDGYREIVRAIEAVPGVTAAGATMASPISGNRPSNFVARSDQAGDQEDFLPIQFRAVTPGFFAAMGVPIEAGTVFDEVQTDALMAAALAGEPVAIPTVISRSLANRLWPEGDPVGETLIWGQPGGTSMSVSGVAGDLRDLSFPMDPAPTVYLPHRFVAWPTMTLVIRVAGSPAATTAAVREAVWSVDRTLPVPQPSLMRDAMAGALAAPRLNMLLLAIFSGSALLLAAVALYGVTAFAVSRRTREIGVRVALGAPKREVMGMALRRGFALVLVGAGMGLVGAALLTRFMESLLFGVGALDAFTYGGVAGLLGAVSLVATILPARKALKVDPTIALQAE
jgi:putative ABC transport system permease protein